MNYNTDNRILAFYGYENTRPASIGQVQVDFSCIKGVTTVETVEETTVIDVPSVLPQTETN